MKIDKMTAVFMLLGGFILFLLIIPILNIFGEQFTFHFQEFIATLHEPSTLKAVGVSLLGAFLSVVVAFTFGVPLAYLIAKDEFRGKGIIEGLIDLPMAIPHTVAGIALLTVFGSGGIIGGVAEPYLHFERSMLGIVTAMTFISAPYMINSAKEGFQSIDPRLDRVARSLGASKWESFKRIDFPLAIPHIFNGAVMSWARAISEFSAVVLFVGFYPTIAPALLWTRFMSQGLVKAMSIAVILLSVLLPTFIILRHIRGRLFDKY